MNKTKPVFSKKISVIMKHAVLIFISIFTSFPLLWMVLSSLKTKTEVMNISSFFPSVPQWNNYLEIILHTSIPKYLFNSLFTAISIVILQVICCALLAYALTFMKFKGRSLLYGMIMGIYMVPTAATYIPCYVLLGKLNLLNSYTGLILSNCVSLFGIFLLRQAFKQVPISAVEAAKIDGAGHFTILKNIMMPMTSSSFITFILISFIGNYNSYMWPSLITDTPELSLVSQGLRRYLYEGGAYGTEWSLVMTASTVVVLPLLILFLFCRRWIMTGIADTGTKG